jgi:dihydrofolate reductase
VAGHPRAGGGVSVAPPLVLVAALDRQRAIGRDNALPWHLPDDFRHFKAVTAGHPMLMGRRTAESLGRALPGRRNLVLTRSGRVPFAGMEAVATLDEACAIAAADAALQLSVIGGGDVFALALPLAARMELTHVDTVVEHAGAFFPAWDADEWRATWRDAHPADARHAHAFEFVTWERVAGPAGDLPG